MYRRRKSSLLDILGSTLKWWWIAMIVTTTVLNSVEDTSWLNSYVNIDWKMLGLQALSLPFILAAVYGLYKLHPGIMGFGLVKLIGLITGKAQKTDPDGNPEIEGTNINLLGTNIKYVGIVVCLVILTGLPRWAMIEEVWFRQGTTDWMDAILRSLAFGFLHMAVGVPLVGALCISGFGLFYTYMYFIGGVELSAQAHFQYNLILISILLLGVTIKSFVKE